MRSFLYLLSLVLLSSCGAQQAQTLYETYCGQQITVVKQPGQCSSSSLQYCGILQPTTLFQKVCGGTATPSNSGDMYQNVANPSCGFYAQSLVPGPEEQLSGSWTPCN